DRPASDSVAVLVQHRRDRRDRFLLAATGDKFGAGRLNISRLVPFTAFQNSDVTLPPPGASKTGGSPAQYPPFPSPPPPPFARHRPKPSPWRSVLYRNRRCRKSRKFRALSRSAPARAA